MAGTLKIKIMRLILVLVAGFLLGLNSKAEAYPPTAENFYTVYIGTFLNAKLSDFDNIRDLGYLYDESYDESLLKIYMGGYRSQKEASRLLDRVKSRGYQDAYVVARPLDQKGDTWVVQLGLLKSGARINWNRYADAGNLFAHLQGEQVKIVTGPFDSKEQAERALPDIRKRGYADAFIKTAPAVELAEVSTFETGGVNLSEASRARIARMEMRTKGETDPKEEKQPEEAGKEDFVLFSFEGEEQAPRRVESEEDLQFLAASIREKAGVAPASAEQPDIRARVSRRSVKDLQKVLKAEKMYTSTIDGLYGPGTRSGLEDFRAEDRRMQKYMLLARELPPQIPREEPTALEQYIQQLPEDPEGALRGLEVSGHPLAKAYRAYYYFMNSKNSAFVNELMNAAVRDAFRGKRQTGLPFDPTATYAYNSLDQLLLHLSYIQKVSDPQPAAPCWLFRAHPKETIDAFSAGRTVSLDYRMEPCDQFMEWEDIRLLHTVAADFCPDVNDPSVKQQVLGNAGRRTQLYLMPAPVVEGDVSALEMWNERFWKSVDDWASDDLILEDMTTSLKVAYFQSQVLLEDYYMDKGLDKKQARSLALFTLHSVINPYMSNF